MKSAKNNFWIVVTLFCLLIGNSAFSQDAAESYKLIYKFSTLKQTDNSRLLEVSFVGQNKEDRKDMVPVYEAEIHFYNVADTVNIDLGTVKTNNEGIAQLVLPADFTYAKDEEGYIELLAEFKGSDGLDRKRKTIKVKDVFLSLDLEIVDSVKTVTLHAWELDSAKEKIPALETDVIFSVVGMLSKLPIEDETVEEGEYSFEFPNDISGDKDGMILLNVYIDDHDDYGSVVLEKSIDWGTFDERMEEPKTALWLDVAPIWMYVVLTLMLAGVWANFLWTILNLIKIKKEGNSENSI